MLWLVKWSADGTAAIVLADDEAELADILDQQGDPFGATFEPYDGPLWIEFQSITEHNTPEELRNYEADAKRPILTPMADNASEMRRVIMERTHPAYYAASQRAFDEERNMTPDELDKALRMDDLTTLRHKFHTDVFEGTPLENLYKDGREISVDLDGRRNVAEVLDNVPGAPDLQVHNGGLYDGDDAPDT